MEPQTLTIKVTYRQYPPDLEALPPEDRNSANPRQYSALTIFNITVNGKDITDTRVEDPDSRPPEEYWYLLTPGTHLLELRYTDNS